MNQRARGAYLHCSWMTHLAPPTIEASPRYHSVFLRNSRFARGDLCLSVVYSQRKKWAKMPPVNKPETAPEPSQMPMRKGG